MGNRQSRGANPIEFYEACWAIIVDDCLQGSSDDPMWYHYQYVGGGSSENHVNVMCSRTGQRQLIDCSITRYDQVNLGRSETAISTVIQGLGAGKAL